MPKSLIPFCFALIFSITLSAQQSAVLTNDWVAYNKALELYNNQQYLAAQALFAQLQEDATEESVKGDCAYYIANCAVRLNQQDADYLMEQFVNEYPTSIKRNDAFINVAHYYFENGKYSYARKWYDKVDEGNLSRGEREKYYFNNGYAYFANKRYSEAQKYFNRVSDSPKYGSQAKYYLGYIAYEGDNYEEANKQFETLENEEKYAEGLSYYKADMNFKLGNFQKAIDLGLEQYNQSSPQEKSELSKIIGESYFNLGSYSEAIPYLKEYKGKRGKWNNTDYYQLGYAYYKQGDYEKAIGEFNKIVDGRNAVAQNAYYHLAESYLKLEQKQQALNAFKNASEMDFSPQIQEDAWLNYAKLSYEIGNSYTSVPQVLRSFLEAYPDNPNNEALKDLLIDSYITSKNYKAALELLENNKSFSNKKAFQKVAFFRGLELYSEGNYADAVALFNKSLKEPYDPIFTARATYWKAESDYQASNFDNSLIGYKQFLQLPEAQKTPEYPNGFYNLAYNYFKLKNYKEAIGQFTKYLESSTNDGTRRNDAYVRLGDSHFMQSAYWPALENYNKAIEDHSPDADYAAFQKAMSYGFVDRVESKLEALSSFTSRYPKSFYRDDALYELGNTYVAMDKNRDAMAAYEKLINELPGSSYVPKALLKEALMLNNSGKSNEALNLFKKVVAKYPSTPEALQAVGSAKLIYIDQGRVNDYAEWVNTLDFVEVENAELDDASYEAAEQPYLENKAAQAISRFEGYLKDFPNGAHTLNAHFYLAQLYFADQKGEKAIPHYQFVLDKERSEFSEQALARISELYLGKKEYQKALNYLKRLETESDYPQNVVFAQTNGMKACYELKRYEEAVFYAEKVLLNEKVEASIKNDAQIIIARAALQTGNETKAKSAYAEVAKNATGKLAAEALYYDAYFKNKEANYEGSNAAVQKLAKDYSGYKFFGAKGLVLMAKNFYALNDAFQATYILQSVIDNFAEFPDVVEEAKAELAVIKASESKTNSSVETDGH
ncbi:MAG TPA: tetratricopeptide repeat protein [Flavobacteriaceae bacterium]|nr:tetratricopeptide repeat protein [Flavobacteriaceae bacterium]MCB9213972.1 tetratricopeptide repeat protein [Alteromonas sp.]HPF11869.1 tetratricopeptide repeat protein [Flavobacteriaceae bacterium]HQU21146.1 tetratricopeptide repeat protein [Flavobacteriaceae bacterium]HQU65346.1 tetratricopeptide repeat protein [Flavobacteriaceae bacterium]